MPNNNKRNSNRKHPTRPAPATPAPLSATQGVGARHTPTPTPTQGGRYQDVCTDENFSELDDEKNRDPRLDELAELGLGKKWLQLAEAIGYDNFIITWMILDSENIVSGRGGDRVRIWVPTFRRYMKYQRNRYIMELSTDMTPSMIKKELHKLLGESLSLPHIDRIAKKAKVKK